MKTFTGQKKLIVGSAIQLLLNYYQENLFVKSCYIYIRVSHKSGGIGELGYLAKYGKM
jgi:hypothetical protein